MKTRIVFLIFIMIVALLPLSAFTQNIQTGKTLVRMGVSQINITPASPTVMAGYGARTTPYTGIHDSLYASAMFFTGEKTKTILISVDLLAFTSPFIDELKSDISGKTGIAPENIMIVTVHNHGGPSPRLTDPDSLKTVPVYLKFLKEKLIALSVQATKKPVPVKMGISKGSCNLNINRRALMANGSIALGRNPDGPCDHDLVVARFEDMNNKLIAVLLNWPCHGTVSGPANYQITGDWPGAAARYIKKNEGNDVVVAVTIGASGDINPIYGPGNNFTEIEAVGFHVGSEVSKLLASVTTYPVNEIQSKSSVLTFPGKKPGMDDFPQSIYEKGPDNEIRLTLLKIGELVLSGISGELVNEIGMEIKKRSPYSGTIVVTHCNGSSGYICTDKMFPEGGYEVRVSKFMPGVEKPLADKYLELIHQF